MSSKKNIPAIRFTGFAGEWETKDFSESFNPLRNNTLSRADLNYDYGDVLNVHYGDILVKFGENIDVESSTIPYITDSIIAQKLVSNQLQNGDVIFADTAEDETAGKCSELMNVKNSIVVSGLHTMPYHPINRYASGYLGYYLNCNSFHNQLIPLMQGTKVMSISKTAIKNSYIRYPEKETEQEQISSYFKNIDHLITKSTKRLEKLKNLKKAYLEKMFPRGGATTPELRFKGFSEEWKEVLLDEVTDVRDGTHESPKYLSSGYRFITSKNIKNGEINFDDVQYISEADYTSINSRSKVDINDILMGMIGTIGNIAIVKYDCEFAIKNVALIKHTGDIEYQYLYSTLQSGYILTQLNGEMDGGTQKFIALNRVRSLLIPFPTKAEQQKIGNFFRNIDEQIAKQTEKLDKLKNIKKACLDRMFV